MDDIKITIPGYKIKQQIGAGGMSVVYLAEQLSLHREVALKVLRPVVCDEAHSVQRFEHEAKTIAQLYHPNIMSIYDVGHLEDGTLFYAMPHLTHGDLSMVLWQDDEHIKSVFMAICDGLSLAHKNGVIHRDLKPENILFDSFGHPQIADFGIAISKQHKKWTKDNSIVGSLNYISPEQAQSQKIDARSDIYALGAMLYEVITNKPVFKEKEELALMLAHVSQAPEPLTGKKQHWQSVISGCLAKLPKHRFQSAAALKQALSEVNSDYIPTQSRPQIPQTRWWYLAASILFICIAWWLWPNTENEPVSMNDNSQFISTGSASESPLNEHYIELTDIDQNQALSQLSQRLKQPWEPDVASSLLDSILFHLTTQPENSLPVVNEYIDKMSESSLHALKQQEYELSAIWQQQLASAQITLATAEQESVQKHSDQQLNKIQMALSDHFNQLNLKDSDDISTQDMLAEWPYLEHQLTEEIKTSAKQNDHDLPVVVLKQNPKLAITATEITVKQFRSFANATALVPERCKNLTISSLRFSSKTWSNPGFLQKNNHPVVCISWQQATNYAQWLSKKTGHTYRLPKANEWWQATNKSILKCSQHNVAGSETEHLKIEDKRYDCQDGYVQTAPVKSFTSTDGIFDMKGNVREWLQGCKKKNKFQSFFSNSDECDSHPTIGQSWLSGQQDAGDVHYEKSDQAWAHIGFRLIREL